ncbi:hypothetical protein A0J61_07553 [Choanephora cucurbitarum]|uniref:CCHC-type domain-containing protein n=1 Tax=Choanephora cucurbitarum TaxID=101091 RepID=A0A1C7NAL0_9FUNG|nr:hypothetical protein A0J61_07553 [Choanephora cucurbitarum]
MDQDSVFIETTHIKDKMKFKNYLNSFNTGDTYIYYGRQPEERTWQSRTFLETSWDTKSQVYAKLISEGLVMQGEPEPLLKGYRSLPSDVHIVRIKIEQLPFMEPKRLLEQLRERMSHFGEVLHLGLLKDGPCFVGTGYAYLNMDTEPDEPLRPIINWLDDRKRILLTWDHVPPFCYICKKEHHIKTECPVYMNTKLCFKCRKPGHVLKMCPSRKLSSEENSSEDEKSVQNEGSLTPRSEASFVSQERIALFLENLNLMPPAELEKRRLLQSQHLKSLLMFQEKHHGDSEENFIQL